MKHISDIHDLKAWLEYEKKRYGINSIVKAYIRYLLGCERETLYFFKRRLRKTEYYKNTNKQIRYYISMSILQHMQNKYGLHINCNVFGKGLKIMHLGPILTNGDTRVGENCSIHINTCLVAGG